MKQIIKHSLPVLALLCSVPALANVVPTILPRSESWQAARELVGTRDQVNLYGKDSLYGTFFMMPGYDRTFKDHRITEMLFCDALATGTTSSGCCSTNCCSSIKISGSQVTSRGAKDLLADYFGLPTDFQSTISFCPQISNFFMDFNLYLGFDEWLEGLYFKIHAPFVHTRWELGFCEKNITAGVLDMPVGYFNSDLTQGGVIANNPRGVLNASLLHKFEDFVANEKTPNLGTTVTFEPLRHAKMYKCTKSENKLSDIQMALGWNFWQNEDYHFGLSIRADAPTASKLRGTYLFEPLVGNGHHWALGGGVSAHWTAWRSEDEINDFSFYLEGNVEHLFKAHQCRTFDLCCKPLSRYMLAEKMTSTISGGLVATDSTAPNAQFNNLFTSVANLTTMNVDVSADVAGNVALMLAWNHRNWGFDLGYEFFGQSSEKICKRCCDDCCCTNNTTSFAENTWALKGDAYVYGFINSGGLTPTLSGATALSATENSATIFAGTNAGLANTYTNLGVDNKKLAEATAGNLVEIGYTTTPLQVYSSFPSIFIKQSDIDMTGVRIIDHKIFGHIQYNWKNHEDWIPYFGVGGEVQFGHRDSKCCPSSCDSSCNSCCTSSCGSSCSSSCGSSCSGSCSSSCNSCNSCCDSKCNEGRNAGLWVWGIWVKGGVSFD